MIIGACSPARYGRRRYLLDLPVVAQRHVDIGGAGCACAAYRHGWALRWWLFESALSSSENKARRLGGRAARWCRRPDRHSCSATVHLCGYEQLKRPDRQIFVRLSVAAAARSARRARLAPAGKRIRRGWRASDRRTPATAKTGVRTQINGVDKMSRAAPEVARSAWRVSHARWALAERRVIARATASNSERRRRRSPTALVRLLFMRACHRHHSCVMARFSVVVIGWTTWRSSRSAAVVCGG